MIYITFLLYLFGFVLSCAGVFFDAVALAILGGQAIGTSLVLAYLEINIERDRLIVPSCLFLIWALVATGIQYSVAGLIVGGAIFALFSFFFVMMSSRPKVG